MHWLVSQIPTAVLGAALVTYLLRPVSRQRVERFAQRQALEITVGNGAVVIDYLATTRRWRVAGFVAGLLASVAAAFTQQDPRGPGLGAVVGWFAGALVAELRTDSRRALPGRRSALLVARAVTDYVPRYVVRGNAVVWAATVALGTTELAVLRPLPVAVVGYLCAAVVVTPVIHLIARRIVDRPQPLAAGDVLAADDALRSRSLHVLAGCTLAANGMLAAIMVSTAQTLQDNWLPVSVSMVLELFGAVAFPILGFFVATEPFAARRVPEPLTGSQPA